MQAFTVRGWLCIIDAPCNSEVRISRGECRLRRQIYSKFIRGRAALPPPLSAFNLILIPILIFRIKRKNYAGIAENENFRDKSISTRVLRNAIPMDDNLKSTLSGKENFERETLPPPPPSLILIASAHFSERSKEKRKKEKKKDPRGIRFVGAICSRLRFNRVHQISPPLPMQRDTSFQRSTRDTAAFEIFSMS